MKRVVTFILLFCLVACCCCGIASNCSVRKGIDVSHHNRIDWSEMKENEIKFCFIKLTEGGSFVDNKAGDHYRSARGSGMKVGFYHYFRTDVSGKTQLESFTRQLGKYKYDLIPVIDIEDNGNDYSRTDEVKAELRIFIEGFKDTYGYYPIVYYGSFNACRFPSVTRKCIGWYRTVYFPKIIPFRLQQVKIKRFKCGKVDINYCADLSGITI